MPLRQVTNKCDNRKMKFVKVHEIRFISLLFITAIIITFGFQSAFANEVQRAVQPYVNDFFAEAEHKIRTGQKGDWEKGLEQVPTWRDEFFELLDSVFGGFGSDSLGRITGSGGLQLSGQSVSGVKLGFSPPKLIGDGAGFHSAPRGLRGLLGD